LWIGARVVDEEDFGIPGAVAGEGNEAALEIGRAVVDRHYNGEVLHRRNFIKPGL
jgi:hypothetical protein